MASRAEIQLKIIDVVTQVTLADKSNVNGDSHLFDDLGVESIDFIDIIYNLDSAFGVEISSDMLFTDKDFFAPESGNWAAGGLTDKGKQALQAFGYLNKARALGPHAQQYLYSIEMLVDFIESKLGETA
ncbi:MAG: acyl carrier protein [Myxococcota bacterium]